MQSNYSDQLVHLLVTNLIHFSLWVEISRKVHLRNAVWKLDDRIEI